MVFSAQKIQPTEELVPSQIHVLVAKLRMACYAIRDARMDIMELALYVGKTSLVLSWLEECQKRYYLADPLEDDDDVRQCA